MAEGYCPVACVESLTGFGESSAKPARLPSPNHTVKTARPLMTRPASSNPSNPFPILPHGFE
jgi:hypothetical protein